MKKDNRTREILAASLALAKSKGFNRLTREDLAQASGCSVALVSHHLGTMTEIHRKVMRHAIHEGCLPVVAQGLAIKYPAAMRAPEELRHRAAESLKG